MRRDRPAATRLASRGAPRAASRAGSTRRDENPRIRSFLHIKQLAGHNSRHRRRGSRKCRPTGRAGRRNGLARGPLPKAIGGESAGRKTARSSRHRSSISAGDRRHIISTRINALIDAKSAIGAAVLSRRGRDTPERLRRHPLQGASRRWRKSAPTAAMAVSNGQTWKHECIFDRNRTTYPLNPIAGPIPPAATRSSERTFHRLLLSVAAGARPAADAFQQLWS